VTYLSAENSQHRVRIGREAPTLLVFDAGSYSSGERRLDGSRLGGPGGLDRGVDIVPAGATLTGWSGVDSWIGCTVIMLGNGLDKIVGASDAVPTFAPAIGMRNDLLAALVARIRGLSASETWRTDALLSETLLALLVQELASIQHSAVGRQACPTTRGGLSLRAQRIIREFIKSNLHQRIDLGTLASQVGMSRFHFARSFKTSFGVSPHRYLLSERVQRAGQLIQQTDDPISEIALRVGFSSSSELSRLFRQERGCAPREFRLRCKAG
jgi:AraC family transcriptional regulator